MMKRGLSITILFFLFFSITVKGGSILLPFWQDGAGVYTILCILNTSQTTDDSVKVRFYDRYGNTQGTLFEKTIPAANLEIFGTCNYPGYPKGLWASLGYAIASETGGMLIAVGIIYDGGSRSGYVIPCFKGNDNLSADPGW